MKKNFIAKIVGTVIVVIAVTFVILNMAGSNAEEPVGDHEKQLAAGDESLLFTKVEVITPVRRPLTRVLHMPATLEADEEVELFAKTSGYVARINVDIGSRVNKGEVLIKIDVPEMLDELRQAEAFQKAMKAKVVQAQAMIDTARAEVQRSTAEYKLKKITNDRKVELREQNVIPQQELDDAESELDIAEALGQIAQAKVASGEADVKVAEAELIREAANVARIKTLMSYATIRAPFNGVVTRRWVDHGDFVRSAAEGTTTPLLTMAKTDRIRLSLEIPEPDAPFVRAGTKVDILVKALSHDLLQAAITRTSFALKVNTRTMRAEVDLDNHDGLLQPGMYAQVVVKLETKENALIIPSKAIRVKGRDVSVLVANGREARALPIKIGYDDGIKVEILEGLNGEEQIIISASSSVAPGAPVNPIPVNWLGMMD